MRRANAEFWIGARRPRAPWWGLCIALSIAAATIAWFAWTARAATREAHALALTHEMSARAPANASPSTPISFAPAPYDSSAREMLSAATVDWPALLAHLESALVADLRVKAFQFEGDLKSARVEIRFARHEAALSFVDTLNSVQAAHGRWGWQLIEIDRQPEPEGGRALLRVTWLPPDQAKRIPPSTASRATR